MNKELLKKYMAAHEASICVNRLKMNLQQKLDGENERMVSQIKKAAKLILAKTPWIIDSLTVYTVVDHLQVLKPTATFEVSLNISKMNKVADYLRTQISFSATTNDVGSMLHELKCYVKSL